MKKKLSFIFSVIAALSLLLTACVFSPKITLGVMENGVYKNNYFGLSVQLPKEWSIQDIESMNQLTESENGSAEGEAKKPDLSQAQNLNFIMASKYPQNQQEAVNPSFICNSENLSFLQNVKTGKDYLESAKTLLIDSQLPYIFEKDIYTEKLGEKDFDVMEAYIQSGSTKVTQRYYSAIIKDYALNFIVTYFDDTSKAEVDNILKTVSFK
ncbi:hypothetical protein DFR58_13135 [Anaerobacterium chartisolvens]|uniref:PsbP protein n=1 Tax=Anaerobacterium chartisolvens TaxID=1297424 RepID=A0A369ALD8_9FIRM|nr:hypothetical protein [Anaerobacterium chartisolvens]RCX09991.1 hypothetical protein DFR58_13135 [Anaerobacterium chartisolvens]